MGIFAGLEAVEALDIGLNLLNLFKNRSPDKKGSSGGATTGAPTQSATAVLLERVINELGWGVRDEGLFPLKLGKLSADDQVVIESVLANHEKRLVDRLRLVTINVPSPPHAKVKAVKGRKDKDGKVLEESEPEKEIPSDIDNGVAFLAYVASALRGKSVSEQVKVLENLNIAPGKGGMFVILASKNIAKKIGKVLGFGEDPDIEQVLGRLKQLVSQFEVPDLRKPGPPVGLVMRIGRAVTPGSYRSAKRPKEGRTVLGVLIGIGIAMGIVFGIALYNGYSLDRLLTKQNKVEDEINLILKNYQPTPLSADKPKQ